MPERSRLSRRLPPVESEPDVPVAYRAAVEAAIQWGWDEVRSRWPEIVRGGREEEITERIQHVLNEQGRNWRRRAPGLDLFESVGRGEKTVCADGRIEKAPDLVFRPIATRHVRNLGHWGVFAECKIIDSNGHHSPYEYCANGVQRFVRGEYAARMSSGTMIAFVRDGRSPYSTLASVLDSTYETLWHERGTSENMSVSCHDRQKLLNRCVDIEITHLWLQTSDRKSRWRKRARGSRS
jgi:hypothetical protein